MHERPYRALILCINYHSVDDTRNFLRSLNALEKRDDVFVLVVDNSDCFSNNDLENENTEVQYFGDNLGYLGGARNGLAFFEKKYGYIPKWVAVSNTDILIEDSHFFTKLFSNGFDKGHGILAPRIVSLLYGGDQNPHMVERPPRWKMALYRYIFASYFTLYIYHFVSNAISWLKSLFTAGKNRTKNKMSPQRIYAAHGSFFLINQEYFNRGGDLNYPSFLFGEEYFLAEKVRGLNLDVYFDPNLVVLHNEHATTGVLPSRRMGQFMKSSARYNFDTFFKVDTPPTRGSSIDPRPIEDARKEVQGKAKTSIASMSFLNLIGNANRVIISFVTSIFASRWLGASDFGKFNLIFGYTAFFNYILTFGFDNSLTYFTNLYKNEERYHLIKKIFKFACVLSICGAVVSTITVYFLAPFISKDLSTDQFFIATAVIMTAQTSFWALASIFSGFLRGLKEFVPTIIRDQIVFPILHLLNLFVFVGLLSTGLIGYSIGYLLASLFTFIYLSFPTFKNLKRVSANPSATTENADGAGYSKWLRFSIPIGITTALDPVLFWGAILISGYFISPEEIGLLSVATKLTIFIQFLFMAVLPISSPYLADYYQKKDFKNLELIIQNLIYWCFQWGVIFSFILFVTGDYVLKIFGPEYDEALYCLFFIVPGSLFEACFGVYKQALAMTGHNKLNVVNQVVAILVGALASLLLVPVYGAIGTALAFSSMFMTVNILRIVEFYIIYKVKPFTLNTFVGCSVFLVILCSLAAFAIGNQLNGNQRLAMAFSVFFVSSSFIIYLHRESIFKILKERINL